MTKPLRIVFMGTPEFAVPSLDALCRSRHQVLTVVTAPDKQAGRGLGVQLSAVKKYALAKNIPVLQPVRLKDSVFLSALKSLNSDLQVVVAFRMLPEEVWRLPPFGTINLHASLLPDYRGAAPINRAIINGEKQTGVTTFILSHELDTGDILMQEQLAIAPDEDAGSLHDRLMTAGAALLVKTVDALAQGTLTGRKQAAPEEKKLKPAPKIFRTDCKIDWRKNNLEIHNFIRGLSPYPGAWTNLQYHNGGTTRPTVLKMYKCLPFERHGIPPGRMLAEAGKLLVGCGNGALQVLELQQEGKKRMSAADFIRGLQDFSSDTYSVL